MDVGQKNKAHLNEKFRDTEGGAWCRENCWRFGFVLRYDEGWEEITGYKFEPWHFRYVGKEYAKEIHDANVPLETWLIGHRTEVLKSLLSDEAEAPAAPEEKPAEENQVIPLPQPATPTDLTEAPAA